MSTRAQAPAYLPSRLGARLGEGGEGECRFDGTVLVANLAGYARFGDVATSSADGAGDEAGEAALRAGLARLARAIEAGLQAVDAFAGEVVDCAGDALVAYWPVDVRQTTRDLALAAACAREMVRASAALHPAGPDDPLLSVGLGRGGVWATRVGGGSGRDHPWLLVGGRATRAAFAAARSAAPGEIRMTAGARRQLEARSRNGGDGGGGGKGAPPDDPEPGRVNDLLDRLAALRTLPRPSGRAPRPARGPDGEARTEPERGPAPPALRPAECLCLRLPTLDEDAPGAPERFRQALSLAQQMLPSGTWRAGIDDRGLTLEWLADLRPDAGVADVAASLPLAARAHAAFQRAGLQPAAGFACGRALTVRLADDPRGDPWLVGPPLLLAARLMERAGPLLLAAGLPEPPAATPPEAERAGEVTLSGFSAPVALFRVRARLETATQPALPQSDLVGRDGEIAALDASLTALIDGRGGVLVIRGPAGMGKSALLRAARAAAARRRVPFALGQACAAERPVPYFPWRSVARALIGELPAPDQVLARQRRLAELVTRAGRDPELLPLLEPFFPSDLVENEATRIVVGENRARLTQDLLLALLESRVTAPQIVALEDLHELDGLSLQLLAQAIRRLPRALFLLTLAPGEIPEAAAAVERAGRCLDLAPLVSDDFARLARSRFGLELLPTAADDICRRARGLPLHGLEYLRATQETLEPADRQAPVALLPPALSAPLPADDADGTTADPLAWLPERLAPPEARLLQAASVLGTRFSPALLGEISPPAEPAGPGDLAPIVAAPLADVLANLLANLLADLARAGWLLPAGAGTAPDTAEFAHPLVEQTVYRSIPIDRRRRLHARVAASLERELPGDAAAVSDERVFALAHHHHGAGNHERSIYWSDQAAARARRQGAHRETLQLLDRCLEDARQLPAPLPAGLVQPPTGLPDPRVRWRRLKAEAAGSIGDGHGRKREAELAIALTGARTASHPLEVYRELSRAHRQLAIEAYQLGHAVELAYNTSRALAHAERLGPSPELSDSLAAQGLVLGLSGFAEMARHHLAAARRMAGDLGDDAAIAYAEASSALFSVGQGDWQSGSEQTERCQEVSQRTGDSGYWAFAQALRFWMHHYQGELDEADRCATALWETAEGAGNRQHQSWAARFRAQGAARRRDWADARTWLETARSLYHEAEKTSRELRPLADLQPILADLGAALHELGDREQAHALEDAALRELGSARRPPGHATLEGCSSIAHLELAALTENPTPENLTRARRALTLLRRYCAVFPIGHPRFAFWHGRLLTLTDRRTPALATWRAGLTSARALGMKYDETLLESALRE